MDLGLEGKVVLITGASGGIGRALADAFAAEDARLVLTAHSRPEELARRVAAASWADRALCLRADASKPSEIDELARRAVAHFGRIDVAIANAGFWPREPELLHRATEERIRHAIDANLMTALFTARAFMAELERVGPRSDGHGASMCFIGSTAGRFGERHHCEYAVAKAGLYGLMRSLKNEIVELDPYARVNLVEPGWTVTEMARPELDRPGVIAKVVRSMPLAQLARAVDIARTVVFLSSPLASRHTTGQVLTIAGGMEGRTLREADDVDEARIRARLKRDS